MEHTKVMDNFKLKLTNIIHHEHFPLFVIILFSLISQFSIINSTQDYIFDESYYVPDAQYNIEMKASIRYEHPPLAKLIIGGGIKIFGYNPWGWRITTVLFSLGSLILVYQICKRLNLNSKTAFIAILLLSTENLFFIHSGIAMLDPFMIFFMLLAFWYYLKGNWKTAAISVALAGLCKLPGFLALIPIVFHWLITNRQNPLKFALSMILFPIIFMLGDTLLEYTMWGRIIDPYTLFKVMIDDSSRITFELFYSKVRSTQSIPSYPWQWFINPVHTIYTLEYTLIGIPKYLGMISPTIWITQIPVVIYSLYKTLRLDKYYTFIFLWIFGTLLIWIPAVLITDRITYIYYVLPAIPAFCIVIAIFIEKMLKHLNKTVRIGAITYIFLHLVTFCILSPLDYWLSSSLCILLFIYCLYHLKVFVFESKAVFSA